MKLLFIDEFKDSMGDHKFYGLIGILIDNSSYMRFKNGFYEKFEKLGWDNKTEIKGCHSFSSKKGDKNITIEERLKFSKEIFDLSKSSGGRYASAKVFCSFDYFSNDFTEHEMYKSIIKKILKKIPAGTTKKHKNGNCNVMMFLDSNNDLDIVDISNFSEGELQKRNLFLIERCLNVDSSNKTPGIIFADFVAYFMHTYLKKRSFNERNINEIKELMNKNSDNNLSKKDKERLKIFVTNMKKERKTEEIISCLKKIIFIN